MTPGALPPAPGRRLEVVLEAVVAEGRLTHIDDEVDGAPTPTVTAVGATARHMRLAPEGGRAITAVAGSEGQRDAIKEHGEGRSVPDVRRASRRAQAKART